MIINQLEFFLRNLLILHQYFYDDISLFLRSRLSKLENEGWGYYIFQYMVVGDVLLKKPLSELSYDS